MSVIDFPQWLINRLIERDWIQADLARRSGLTTAAISRIITQNRQPGKKALEAFSRAFDLPLEEVYRAAGLLPCENNQDMSHLVKTITYLSSQLDKEDQEEIIVYIQTKKRIGEQRGKYRVKRPGTTQP